MMQTTLKAIRKHGPCKSGWVKLLVSLGKTKADDEPLSLLEILKSNGLDDALWCLRAVEGYEKEIRLYAVWCARQVQHLMTDPRSLNALDVAEAFAKGKATKEEWKAAEGAAWAAEGAAWAAWAAGAAGAAAGAAWAATGAAGAATGAAKGAAGAAECAAGAARAAGAAKGAAGAAQEKELIRICKLSEKEISHV